MGVKPPENLSLSIVGKAIPKPDDLKVAKSKSSSVGEDGSDPVVDSFEVRPGDAGSQVRSVNDARAERMMEVSLTTPAVRNRRRDPLLRSAIPVATVPGESWEVTLTRHYQVPLSPVLLDRIVAANEPGSPGVPPKTVLAPALESIYQEFRGKGSQKIGKAIERADLVLVEEGQPLEEVIRSHYGNIANFESDRIDDEFVRVVGIAAKALNGGSRYTQDSVVVALPRVEDLGKLIDRIRSGIARIDARREDQKAQEGSNKNGVPIPGEPEKVATMGRAYEPEFGEKLGDVAAYVYRDYLTRPGMSEDEAAEELQEIMLSVMRWNRMATMDLANQPKMYWPTVEQLEVFRSNARVIREVENFKKSAPAVWEGIKLACRGTQARAEAAKLVKVSHLGTTREQLKAVDKVADTVFDMQLKQMWADSKMRDMPYFGTVWYEEEFEGDEVYAGSLAARKPGESDEVYAARLFEDTLSESELKEFTNRTDYLVATHLGIMDRNGGFEPGKKAAIQADLEGLGLVTANGRFTTTHFGSHAGIDQATVELVNRAMELDLQLEPGEAIDGFLERASWYTYSPEQFDLINHIWFWNAALKEGVSSIREVPRAFGGGESYDFVYLGGFLSEEEEALIESLYRAAEVIESGYAERKMEDTADEVGQVSLDFLRGLGTRLVREGTALEEMSEDQLERFQDSMEQLVEYLMRLELQEEEYQEKMVVAIRVLSSRILAGEAVGGPDKWFI